MKKVTLETMWQTVKPYPPEAMPEEEVVDLPIAQFKRDRLVAFVVTHGPCTARHVAERMFLNSSSVSAMLGQAVRAKLLTCEKRHTVGVSQLVNFYRGA
jgi:hypothetical protein